MSSSHDWTLDLQPLVNCKVLPKVPGVDILRRATSASLQLGHGVREAASSSSLFASQQLYDAVMRCVEMEPGIPARTRTPAALLVASLAMEEFVRSHSTKARLSSEHRARQVRAAAAEAAAVAAANAAADAARGPAGDDEGDEDAELLGFLRSATPEQVVERLLRVLGEPETSRGPLTNIVRARDPDTLAAILRQTRLAFESGDTERADGAGKRTRGGVFFREAKRYKATQALSAAASSLPPLPPLRPYQVDVVGMVLTSWGLGLHPGLPQQAGVTRGQGGAAVEAGHRFRGLAGGWVRNWLVCAPTNSGKTRMFVEVTRGLIASQPPGRGAVVVVLVPQAILSTQHTTYFERACLPRTSATAYSSDNSLTLPEWKAAVAAAAGAGGRGGGGGGTWAGGGGGDGRGRGGGGGGGTSCVLVCTAQSVLNVLQQGARLQEVDLLILDEAHHCKDDHPYAQIVNRYYSAAAAGGVSPRLLGVTASPASEKDPATLAGRMSALLTRLGAKLHVLSGEDDEQLAAAVPEPKQIECPVRVRAVDKQLMLALQSFAIHSALELAESLADAEARGAEAKAEKLALEQALESALTACQTPAAASLTQQYLATQLDPLGQWLARGVDFAARYGCHHLGLACRFLDVLRKAVELVEDAGFEGALPFLARKAAALCREEDAAARGQAAGGGALPAAALPHGPAPSAFRDVMLAAALEAAAALPAAAAGVATGAGAAEPRLFAALRAASADLPSARDAAAAEARSSGREASPRSRCSDVDLRVSRLLRELLVEGREVQFLAAPESARLARDCFASGELQEHNTFPKFWALLQYLQKYRGRDTFHGIIFVKTRQAVFHVADMIRRTQQLTFLEVFELIGQSSAATKRATLAPEHERHGRGMSDMQQQHVLRIFKEPGRKVLVATSAAEEGLDVPSCEFVVRYNAAATGIQLLQSRGRARRKVAEFFAILQDGTLDTALHAKSRLEEANMRAYCRVHTQVTGGRGGEN